MNPRARRTLSVVAATTALAVLSACATGGAEPGREPGYGFDRDAYLESFDQVWTTIRDRHWDPELGGVDWEAVRDELRPEMEAAASRSEARAVLHRLVGSLGLTHYAILTGAAADDLGGDEASEGSGGSPGIDLRIVDGRAVVTRVDEGTAAAEAGIRPGWVLLEVEGKELAPRLAELAATYEDSTLLASMQVRAVTSRLEGSPGTTCTVRALDADDGETTLALKRSDERGQRVDFGHFPTIHVWMETGDLAEGRVGYAAFNYFFDPARLMAAFGEMVTAHRESAGIVIDLRGNPGGIGVMAMGMAGWFVDQKGLLLGTMYTRDAPLKFVVNPRLDHFDGPVAILVDGQSASTSEILAGGMQDIGRARIFGSRTAGAALPSVIERLPTGEAFQYAMADYVSVGGEHLEGVGVEPDVTVAPTRRDLLEGRDPVLEAALAWILEQD